MECNKTEALRAKALAEEKLGKKEFFVARMFAMKAENLFPGIDGISQLLATIKVYISAEKKIRTGEVDWYSVLDLDPSVNEEGIKKQYRKLALMLHPDKNKSVGANDVFVLISNAFQMLSDRVKRSDFDLRRASRPFQQKAPMDAGGSSWSRPSAPSSSTKNWGFNRWSTRTSKPPTYQCECTPPPPPPAWPAPNFWSNTSATTQNKCTPPPRPTPTEPAPTPPAKAPLNGSSKTSSTTQNKIKPPQPSPTPPPPSLPALRISSFRIICKRCGMTLEYSRMFLNSLVICHNCKFLFMTPPIHPPPPAEQAPNCRTNTTSRAPSTAMPFSPPGRPTPTPLPSLPPGYRTSTFRTSCQWCGMQFEYLNTYLLHNIPCRNCKHEFIAVPTAPPPLFSRSYNVAPPQQQQSSSIHIPSQTHGRNIPAATKSTTDQGSSSSYWSANFQQADRPPVHNGGHQAQDKGKRPYETKSWPDEESSKKRKFDQP